MNLYKFVWFIFIPFSLFAHAEEKVSPSSFPLSDSEFEWQETYEHVYLYRNQSGDFVKVDKAKGKIILARMTNFQKMKGDKSRKYEYVQFLWTNHKERREIAVKIDKLEAVMDLIIKRGSWVNDFELVTHRSCKTSLGDFDDLTKI